MQSGRGLRGLCFIGYRQSRKNFSFGFIRRHVITKGKHFGGQLDRWRRVQNCSHPGSLGQFQPALRRAQWLFQLGDKNIRRRNKIGVILKILRRYVCRCARGDNNRIVPRGMFDKNISCPRIIIGALRHIRRYTGRFPGVQRHFSEIIFAKTADHRNIRAKAPCRHGLV